VLTTLEDVIERIVTGYAPDRIILFGSHASGEARDGSDFDLLIVKETRKRPIDRRVEVERLLSDRCIPLDLLVLTPLEIRQLYALGSPLIEEVVETGRVLYMRKSTQAWLAEANDDLESASILFRHGRYRATCFHSQQCVEKTLKALILERGKRPPRTHDIVDLLNRTRLEGWSIDLAADEAAYLNSIYRGRYPTEEGLLPHGEPTAEEAQRAIQDAEATMAQVRAILP